MKATKRKRKERRLRILERRDDFEKFVRNHCKEK